MPLSSAATNGHFNGCNGKTTDSYDMEDGQTFLFTSESVGEGHPGKYYFWKLLNYSEILSVNVFKLFSMYESAS